MKVQRLTGCSQDCYDNCAVIAQLEGGKLISLQGNPNHPQTGSWLCAKGKAYIERVYHPTRLLHPLLKTSNGFKKITWEEAYDLITVHLRQALEIFGPLSILHYEDYGSAGALKSLSRRFFNALGGCTSPTGGLCLAAGAAAQTYDFGGNQAHDPNDILHSSAIILWGRDPEKTNQHLLPILQKAKQQGALVIVINPLPLKLPFKPDLVLQPLPGTDSALALACSNQLIQAKAYDYEFIRNYTVGFELFAKHIKNYTLDWAVKTCGINLNSLDRFFQILREYKPTSFLLGWGLQRRQNGGQTVRAIDALGALTGNIGIQGGGVNYANFIHFWNKGLEGKDFAKNTRQFIYATMAEDILQATNPSLQFAMINRANPVCQLPNTSKVIAAFSKIPFKVVIDQFMTDTAQLADLVLPCTTYLEEDNLYKNSWHNMIILGEKVIEPQGETKSDELIFTELAQRMGIGKYFARSIEEWLDYALEPMKQYGVSLEALRKGPMRPSNAFSVAWANKLFNTPSGKFEFYSTKALQDGLSPLPIFTKNKASSKYPLILLTPHSKYRINSQFANIESVRSFNPEPRLDIHPDTADLLGLDEGDEAIIQSPQGSLQIKVRLSPGIHPTTVSIEEGWWIEDGVCVNFLTSDIVSDMGNGASYYDCPVKIVKP